VTNPQLEGSKNGKKKKKRERAPRKKGQALFYIPRIDNMRQPGDGSHGEKKGEKKRKKEGALRSHLTPTIDGNKVI